VIKEKRGAQWGVIKKKRGARWGRASVGPNGTEVVACEL
jgi:hypothetical protein